MNQETISREALYVLVWSESLLSLSKKYDLSDNGFRKLCTRMRIPLPKNGHWQQAKFGKQAKQPPLPSPYSGDTEVRLALRQEDKTHNRISQAGSKSTFAVPERLTKPHPLIIRSKVLLEKAVPDSYRYLNILGCSSGALDIRVTKSNIGRALRFMDSLIKALETAGHELELNNGKTYVRLGTDNFQVFLREKTKRVNDGPKGIGFSRYLPTGKLAFSIGIGHFREFPDGRLLLKEQLPIILEHLEAINQQWSTLRLSQRLDEEKKKEDTRLLQDAEDLKKQELIDFNTLLEKAERWHKSDNLRRYINEVERRATLSGNVDEDIQRWLQWARQKAEWYDPFGE